jgi:uncharacterized protein YfaS (alpha-2-macroglobulin family)
MRSALAILLCLFPWLSIAEETEGNPEAGEVQIEPSEGEIQPGATIRFTFPTAMVSADRLDVANQPLPFRSEPELQGEFLWKSPTEGVFAVRGVIAGVTHHLTLVPRLVDADGKPVNSANWSAEFTTPAFSIGTDFEESEHLSSQIQIPLTSTYDVKLAEVAEHAYFQDRDSRQRFAAEAIQTGENSVEAKGFRVGPREPLPVGRTYGLVINGLLDAKSRQPLPYPKVFPVGKAAPLKIEWVGAFNHPLQEPEIRVKFTDSIDPGQATPDKIRIEPSVPNLRIMASGDVITAKGDFDLAQHYRVAVSPELKGDRGYSLEAESRWGATFHAKEPCIVFPYSDLFLRAHQELRFSFLQINTPKVTWKLARIPLEKLGAVRARVTEFTREQVDPLTGKPELDPRTGFYKTHPTELLADAFDLAVVGRGESDASIGNTETLREIRCTTEGPISGPYLFEASSSLADGHIVGNRAIVFVSDFIFSEKRTPTTAIVRLAKMADAQPVSAVTVRAITADNIELGRAVTNKDGIATFPRKLFPPKRNIAFYVADTANGTVVRSESAEGSFESGNDNAPALAPNRATIITDRNLYRPGQTVKTKGMMRNVSGTGLIVPAERQVQWRIVQGDGNQVAGEGTAVLSDSGGWEAGWSVPEKAATGHYVILCRIGDNDYAGSAAINIEEYRVPLFSVVLDSKREIGTTAHARLSSAYFHGAPNAGARVHWQATWTATAEISGDNSKCYNAWSEIGPRLEPDSEQIKSIEGDTQLDGRGQVSLECESPFKENAAIGHASVTWRADVISVDGQTITGGTLSEVFSARAHLAVRASEGNGPNRAVHVKAEARDFDDQSVGDIPVHVDIYHVVSKTVKEQVATFVYRYRNTDQYTKIASQDAKTPNELIFPVQDTGNYIAAVSTTGLRTPLVSDETTVTGEEIAELPVENETGLQIDHQAGPFKPGETAVLTTKAPFAGVAWVSVETNEILDTFLVPLAGNAGRIELPIKAEYAPNAFVSVYLTRPGGERGFPRERFGFTELAVQRLDRQLKIEPHLQSGTVRPGQTVHCDLHVTSEGKPVANAELAAFVVDDAVLQLGDWHLPDVIGSFYYQSLFGVRSFHSLSAYQEEIARKSLMQKGFVIGDGGAPRAGNVLTPRKEFRTLAFWQSDLITDKSGNATFEFSAPDNLTAYRVVVVGQTKESQFGGDASATIKVSKPVLVEAALPRFLRNGDQVELRAVVHQNFVGSDKIRVRCFPDSSLQLADAAESTQAVERDVPAVFRFKAKISDAGLNPAKIRFEAVAQSDSQMADSVELSLPVEPPTIKRTESVAGSFNGPDFDAVSVMPKAWNQARGKLDLTVSTSPWLAKILGLPAILNYPHGCFEQISSRMLGYALMGNLLAYFPEAEVHDAEYRAVIEKGIQQFDQSLLENGMLPYWPGGHTANPFATVQALWALDESENAGFDVPERLTRALQTAAANIVQGRAHVYPFGRVFTLFVLSQRKTAEDFKATAEDLYLRRNDIGDEGRALLALALHQLGIMPKEQEQLLREIDAPAKERAFDPDTFTSITRAEAINAVAFQTIAPTLGNPDRPQRVRDRLLALMNSSASLSTQENLWLLLAFKSMLGSEQTELLQIADARSVFSKNHRSAAWLDLQLSDVPRLKDLGSAKLTYLMKAVYTTDAVETDRVDRGFRVERVIRNLTDPKRSGNADAPFKLGDQVLITYRISTQKLQNYVALEDSLPSGLETVNPDLAMIGKFFSMPPLDAGDNVLFLSHSELRDRSTLLYFDSVSAGTGTYSILARATAAGSFRWPATQVVPMYDSRFSGLSPSSICVVSGE